MPTRSPAADVKDVLAKLKPIMANQTLAAISCGVLLGGERGACRWRIRTKGVARNKTQSGREYPIEVREFRNYGKPSTTLSIR